MSAEFGQLPSVTIFGSEALQERSSWHVAFDFAVWRQLSKARDAATKPKNKNSRGQKMYSGDNLPDVMQR